MDPGPGGGGGMLLEDFGQRVDLTRRIREVLANYPEGTTALRELVQNADDAGASRVRLCLDRRSHGAASLLAPPFAQWQGPALLAHNDAVFTDDDFASISRIGDSKKVSQAWKTGRFGYTLAFLLRHPIQACQDHPGGGDRLHRRHAAEATEGGLVRDHGEAGAEGPGGSDLDAGQDRGAAPAAEGGGQGRRRALRQGRPPGGARAAAAGQGPRRPGGAGGGRPRVRRKGARRRL